MFRVDSIEGNCQRLDGGSMYGNCPRAVWQKWSPPDEAHRIDLACRSMLVRDGERTVLLETGIGAFFEPKLRNRFGVLQSDHVLLASLEQAGVPHDAIDVVVLSHMHFDHAGGLLSAWRESERYELLFPRATFVVGRRAWERATAPHPRDRASFIVELHDLLRDSGRLELVDEHSNVLPADTYSFSFSDGHTPGLTMTRVQTPRGPITFVGDAIPGVPWVHLPITMGYDRYPERLIEEKRELLDRIIAEQGWIYFTHDPTTVACRVERSDKGRYQPVEPLTELHWSDE